MSPAWRFWKVTEYWNEAQPRSNILHLPKTEVWWQIYDCNFLPINHIVLLKTHYNSFTTIKLYSNNRASSNNWRSSREKIFYLCCASVNWSVTFQNLQADDKKLYLNSETPARGRSSRYLGSKPTATWRYLAETSRWVPRKCKKIPPWWHRVL